MRSSKIIFAAGLTTLTLASALACNSSSDGTSSQTDSGANAQTDSGTSPIDSGVSPVDSGASVTFLAHFDKSKGQLPEGLWQSDAGAIAGWAPLATLVNVASDGTTQTFATAGSAANTFTLGIVGGSDGALYFGVGAAAVVGGAAANATPVTPAPGVYRLAAGASTANVYSLGTNATPPMSFANGLAFRDNKLFVADSEGVIFTIDNKGAATTWSQDPVLSPSQPACGGVVPLAVGANGIVVSATDVYVTNTNYGRLVDIPIEGDGRAGTPKVIVEDCAKLAGADGLARASDGSFVIAVNAQNRIAHVTASGAISIIAQGAPLDTPASVLFDTKANGARLLVTNSSFFSGADAGSPGVLAVPFP